MGWTHGMDPWTHGMDSKWDGPKMDSNGMDPKWTLDGMAIKFYEKFFFIRYILFK